MKMARQLQENLFSWSCIAIFGGGRDAHLAAGRSCAAADSPEGRGCGRDVRYSDISAKIRFGKEPQCDPVIKDRYIRVF